jgi:hypothetical protein
VQCAGTRAEMVAIATPHAEGSDEKSWMLLCWLSIAPSWSPSRSRMMPMLLWFIARHSTASSWEWRPLRPRASS